MNTADEFKKLERTTQQLRGAQDKFRKERSAPSADKTGFGFNLDDRFSSLKVTLALDSWVGYYGSSSCSRVVNIEDTEAAKRALVKWMNIHLGEILAGMADIVEQELVGPRQKYIDQLKAELARLGTPQEQQP